MYSLEDHTLCLGHLLHIEVLDHPNPDEAKDHNTCSSSKHPSLGITIGLLNGDALEASNRVRELGRKTRVDCSGIRHGGFGQIAQKSREERVGPDGAGDGAADGASNAGGNKEQRENGSNMLVVNGGENGELLAEDEDTSRDGDEDLAHNNVPNLLVGATEVDHQSLSEDVERNGPKVEPLEAAGPADEVAHAE